MEVAMKTLLIAFAAVLLAVSGGALAMMNNACKTGHHSWCRPVHISGSDSGHQKRLLNGSRESIERSLVEIPTL
jgi:hypothetical protein